MVRLYFLLLLGLCPSLLLAQKGLSRNVVYLEALGLGTYYSFNYERNYYLNEPLRLGIRIGLAPWNVNEDYFTSVPVGVHLLYGKSAHRLEIGMGLSYRFKTAISTGSIQYHKWEKLAPARIGMLIGYRYQVPDGGWMFRLGYQPFLNGFIEANGYVRPGYVHWLGIAVGYAIPYYRTRRDND
ncbi:MAG: hypothetical protein AAF927_05480 [Bacteroidota bacterium]